MKKSVAWVLGLAVLALGAWFWLRPTVAPPPEQSDTPDAAPRAIAGPKVRKTPERKPRAAAASDARPAEAAAEKDETETSAPERPSAAEEAERRAEAAVEAFDSLTDAWMEENAKRSVTMDDVAKFCDTFRKVPKDRQDECIHRALNLIPDDNVMLLAGVLMDKSMDREIVETVYNDILNRDETVKKPILKQVFQDKSHPCWADTAWILDVTGETPKGSKGHAPTR